MRILLIHNKYKQSGGEDAVFDMERKLLEQHNHVVKALVFDNATINTSSQTLKLGYRLLYNRNSSKVIERAIDEFKPDVAHVHNFFYVASPSIFFAAHKKGIPMVVTLHNYRLICSGSLLMRNDKPCELCVNKVFPLHAIQYGCHRNSRIQSAQLTMTVGIHKVLGTWKDKVTTYISLTNFAKSKFSQSSLRLQPERIAVKPNSVDDPGSAGHSGRQNFFLYVGRLSNEKGIEVLLQSFVAQKNIIEIIGDGPLREMVMEAARKNANIKYLGFQDKTAVYERLKACRALVVPSICYENLPTAVLEAFATGTPVIISDIGNLNEVVTNNYNGLHFKTNNAQDLSRIICTFAENHNQMSDLYMNARQTFDDHYTHEKNYQNLLKIYQDARSRKPKDA